MRVRLSTLIAALIALAIIPSIASAAPKKVFFKFSSTAYSVTEGNKVFNVTVQRSGNLGVAASATVTDNATGSATSPANYTFSPVTVNFARGETTKTVPVTIVDNTAFEANHTIVLKLTAVTPSGSGSQVKTPTSTITILEDDGPGSIELASTSVNVVESAGVATIGVTRTNSASNLRESIDYATTALAAGTGHATAGVDYLSASGTLTFEIGQTSKTFQVPVTDDSLFEGPETLGLTLSNPRNLTNPLQAPNVGPAGTLTIVDDDVATFAFSNPTYSVMENAGTATVTVTRGGATNVAASVDYSDAGTGSASAGNYSLTAGTLNFAAGETSKTFPVTINDNGLQEANKTIGLQLTDHVTADQLGTATLSIVDDDNPSASIQFSDVAYSAAEGGTATVTVTLSKAIGSTVQVHYATADEASTGTNNPATAGSDYTAASGTLSFAPGETSKTFQVSTQQDSSVEGDETLDLQLSSPSNAVQGAPATAVMTIADDDLAGSFEFTTLRYDVNETGSYATVTVRRINGASGAVSVDYATSDGSATAPADYTATSGTLNFADGDTQKTFTVPVVWDGQGEGPETVNLTLSNPTGQADLGTNTAAVLHIADDGASGPLQLTSTSYDVNEADGLVTITVTRSGGSLGGTVTVDYATSDGSATAGDDYTATSGTLTFGPGEASKSFTVPIAQDSVYEGGETFQVLLSNPGGGANLGTPAGATVTIADDDPAPAGNEQPPVAQPPVQQSPAQQGSELQSTPSNPNPEGSQTAAADKRAPKLALSYKRVQKAFKSKALVLVAKCDENCSLRITAKGATAARKTLTLGKLTKKAARGQKAQLKLKLSKKTLAKLAKLLKKGKAKITVTIVAADAAGNATSISRTITVRA
ncbi:MAG TPA: Calx-beta domain-containing protein [Thermoleophilaceae bacterium]|nr:Calx-beta domain-containing protein [Thermoleophilaceae bacterium]